MAKDKKRKGRGQANVSTAVTAERLRINRQRTTTERPLSAAQKAVMRTTAPAETQEAAAKALRASRRIRRVKKSPGFTLEVSEPTWPIGEGKLSPKNPSDTHPDADFDAESTVR